MLKRYQIQNGDFDQQNEQLFMALYESVGFWLLGTRGYFLFEAKGGGFTQFNSHIQ